MLANMLDNIDVKVLNAETYLKMKDIRVSVIKMVATSILTVLEILNFMVKVVISLLIPPKSSLLLPNL